MLFRSKAIGFYLEELHRLGGELSMDGRLVRVSDALRALADRSPDRAERRGNEPYRRAITGMYARLAATARELDHFSPNRPAVGEAPSYAAPAELRTDLDALFDSLARHNALPIARGRLRHLRRAVDVFGFHLAGIDLRQNAEVHERVVGELFEMAREGTGDRKSVV